MGNKVCSVGDYKVKVKRQLAEGSHSYRVSPANPLKLPCYFIKALTLWWQIEQHTHKHTQAGSRMCTWLKMLLPTRTTL